jgi:muconolactone delta-isomerase
LKLLAIERHVNGVADNACEPFLSQEAHRVWELYQQGIIREIYFRQDWPGAVLMLECENMDDARNVLATLPLVEHRLIEFDIIPLRAYPGFERLFAKEP